MFLWRYACVAVSVSNVVFPCGSSCLYTNDSYNYTRINKTLHMFLSFFIHFTYLFICILYV